MNLQQFRDTLAAHPNHGLRFTYGDGNQIADHFHVTEVGRVLKQFVDCGGESRECVACVLQTLVAEDTEHRLTTGKLTGIMSLADKLDLTGDAPVEVEHQERTISIDAVDSFEVKAGVLEFRLAPKQTACLAADACGIGTAPAGLSVIGQDEESSECCGSTGCC